jgi:hypothetical protein
MTHFLDATHLEGDDFFAQPALCGFEEWTATTDEPELVTCPECRKRIQECQE